MSSRAPGLAMRQLERAPHDSAGSSTSTGTGDTSPGAFFDVARFWKGAEIAQPGVPNIIPAGGRPLSEFTESSISTVSGSQGNSADGGSDCGQESERISPVEVGVAEWARGAHAEDLEVSDNDSGSAYSHASAVDLAGIDVELGLAEGLTLSPLTTTDTALEELSPPPAPCLSLIHI